MDTVPDEEFSEIFERIQLEIDLLGCQTPEEIAERLLQHPKADDRIITLIEHGFPRRVIQEGLLEEWRKEKWKGKHKGEWLVWRDAKGRIRRRIRVRPETL